MTMSPPPLGPIVLPSEVAGRSRCRCSGKEDGGGRKLLPPDTVLSPVVTTLSEFGSGLCRDLLLLPLLRMPVWVIGREVVPALVSRTALTPASAVLLLLLRSQSKYSRSKSSAVAGGLLWIRSSARAPASTADSATAFSGDNWVGGTPNMPNPMPACAKPQSAGGVCTGRTCPSAKPPPRTRSRPGAVLPLLLLLLILLLAVCCRCRTPLSAVLGRDGVRPWRGSLLLLLLLVLALGCIVCASGDSTTEELAGRCVGPLPPPPEVLVAGFAPEMLVGRRFRFSLCCVLAVEPMVAVDRRTPAYGDGGSSVAT